MTTSGRGANSNSTATGKLEANSLPASWAAMKQMPASASTSSAGLICRRDTTQRDHLAPSVNQIRNTGPIVRLGSALARYQYDQNSQ